MSIVKSSDLFKLSIFLTTSSMFYTLKEKQKNVKMYCSEYIFITIEVYSITDSTLKTKEKRVN